MNHGVRKFRTVQIATSDPGQIERVGKFVLRNAEERYKRKDLQRMGGRGVLRVGKQGGVKRRQRGGKDQQYHLVEDSPEEGRFARGGGSMLYLRGRVCVKQSLATSGGRKKRTTEKRRGAKREVS